MGHYWFGPLGRLMVVDVPDGGFDDPIEEIGGMHESLNGTRTKDVLGHKATYKIRLDGLDPRALSWFEMAYRGALGYPLYFVDEQRINRLNAAASTARSAWSEVDPFVITSGTLAMVANPNLLLPGTQDGATVQTPGPARSTTWTTTIGATLKVGDIVPVREGEHLVFSLYVSSGTPSVEFTPFDASLTPLAQAGATQIIAGTPPRRYVTYTVPAGVAAVRPLIRHPGAQASTFTGLQLEAGDLPSPWVQGAGVGTVLVDSFPLTRRKIANHTDAELTLVEA
jgi:hypothetical protein